MIKLESISIVKDDETTVSNISYQFQTGGNIFFGDKNSNKSLIFKSLINDVEIETGQVIFENNILTDMSNSGRESFINENVTYISSKIFTTIDNKTPREFIGSCLRFSRFASQSIISELISTELSNIKLLDKADTLFEDLTLGEKIRVLIAACFSRRTKYILLDGILDNIELISDAMEICKIVSQLIEVKKNTTTICFTNNEIFLSCNTSYAKNIKIIDSRYKTSNDHDNIFTVADDDSSNEIIKKKYFLPLSIYYLWTAFLSKRSSIFFLKTFISLILYFVGMLLIIMGQYETDKLNASITGEILWAMGTTIMIINTILCLSLSSFLYFEKLKRLSWYRGFGLSNSSIPIAWVSFQWLELAIPFAVSVLLTFITVWSINAADLNWYNFELKFQWIWILTVLGICFGIFVFWTSIQFYSKSGEDKWKSEG